MRRQALTGRSRHIRVQLGFVQDAIASGEIHVKHVRSEANPANTLTAAEALARPLRPFRGRPQRAAARWSAPRGDPTSCGDLNRLFQRTHTSSPRIQCLPRLRDPAAGEQRIRAESTSVEIPPYSPTTDSRLIRHHTSASSCTCTYTATPHVHVQTYLQSYMYMLTCTCTHKPRAMRSTWKSPLPNMIRVHFRSGLLWERTAEVSGEPSQSPNGPCSRNARHVPGEPRRTLARKLLPSHLL